jgi:DNA-binding NtrC family response regulator
MRQAMSSNPFTSDELFRQPLSELQKPYVPVTGSDSIRDPGDSILLGESVAVRRLRSQIRRIAPHFRIALLRGEIGSGKQLVARSIHALSPGAGGPFVVINACVLAEILSRGAATRPASAASVLDSARGGTLYLTGVGELSYGPQETLLRFLRICEDRRATAPAFLHRFQPPDTCMADARSLDVRGLDRRGMGTRILAASDRDLRTLSAIGQFRQDLYAHLSAVEILVPPLRQRIEDIPILAAWLLRRLAEESGQVPKLLAEATLAQLQERAWPSNLVELERVIAQASALAEAGLIEPRHLLALVEPRSANPAAPPAVRMERLHDVMLRHVLDVLTRCSGNKARAAELLGISRSTLYRMLGTGSAAAHSLAE